MLTFVYKNSCRLINSKSIFRTLKTTKMAEATVGFKIPDGLNMTENNPG